MYQLFKDMDSVNSAFLNKKSDLEIEDENRFAEITGRTRTPQLEEVHWKIALHELGYIIRRDFNLQKREQELREIERLVRQRERQYGLRLYDPTYEGARTTFYNHIKQVLKDYEGEQGAVHGEMLAMMRLLIEERYGPSIARANDGQQLQSGLFSGAWYLHSFKLQLTQSGNTVSGKIYVKAPETGKPPIVVGEVVNGKVTGKVMVGAKWRWTYGQYAGQEDELSLRVEPTIPGRWTVMRGIRTPKGRKKGIGLVGSNRIGSDFERW
jgi:hypothetical protein